MIDITMTEKTLFEIKEHKVESCHIREYAGSTINQEEILHLHVKQYTPLDNFKASSITENAVTIIATHGAGIPKELYEPLWDDLYEQLNERGVAIRGIWVADAAGLGLSGLIDEGKLSNDYSWMDHSRDLLLMINQFRKEMPRPIVGIGHSFGGCQITNLAYLHPRLFTTLILMDPVIQLSPPPMGFGTDMLGGVNYTTYRQDIWPNRKAAAESQAKVSKNWDPRVLNQMIKFGYRDLPTTLYPDLPSDADSADPPVTLTTNKYQDAFVQLRENFSARQPDGRIKINHITHADMDPLAAFVPLYRPEPRSTFYRLPSLRPSVLWLVGEKTYLRLDEMREGIKVTGTGVGGSGGIPDGRVKEIVMSKQGHLFPFEATSQTAKECSEWLAAELETFRETEKQWRESRKHMTVRDHMVPSQKWLQVVKRPSRQKNKL
ncbi:hypothetical protein EAE99_006389 [Botrytis elliptica]|nr:hypothetical protein EAE99_006389 [Botrytis elliptica]